MPPPSGFMAPIAMRMLRHAVRKTSAVIRSRLAEVSRPINGTLEPIVVRNAPKHPLHPQAVLRQRHGRWYSSQGINASLRRFMSSGNAGVKYDRSKLPKSTIATAVNKLPGRAPFASTLRPNLTGGAIPRTAGGYTLGGSRLGGARHFSHTPAAPAEVINNVSAAVRAFWISGQKAQFDGTTPRGEKRFRSVSAVQHEATRKLQSLPTNTAGSYIDFYLNPTVTALSPLAGAFTTASNAYVESTTLNTEGFLDVLSIDFSRALKDLAAVMNDLQRLSVLGDLPISMEGNSTLRIRFPGCDAYTVERLCDEVGIQRGIVREDPEFEQQFGDKVTLTFPLCPTSDEVSLSPSDSIRSEASQDFELFEKQDCQSPWLSSPDGYETMDAYTEDGLSSLTGRSQKQMDQSDYEGVEGLYRFIEECDRARRIG